MTVSEARSRLHAPIAFEQLSDLLGHRSRADVPCLLCGPDRRTVANKNRKVLRIWRLDAAISFHCCRCGENGWSADNGATRLTRPSADRTTIDAEIQRRDNDEARERLKLALSLWRRRSPIGGTAAEAYLREARGYSGSLPATLGVLPATDIYPPTMIGAFGMARETLPGDLAIDDAAVRGVHLTKLKPDGSGKAGTDRDKIMIGKSTGFPIVVAPVNDGLGLAICEGIEDALSLHEVTGLGAWAAGSAGRLAALADKVPSYVEAVSIIADDDNVGRSNANALGKTLLRSREVRILVPGSNGT